MNVAAFGDHGERQPFVAVAKASRQGDSIDITATATGSGLVTDLAIRGLPEVAVGYVVTRENQT